LVPNLVKQHTVIQNYPLWCAPETLLNRRSSVLLLLYKSHLLLSKKKQDIWALGIVALELADRIVQWKLTAVRNNILCGTPPWLLHKEFWTSNFTSFIERCLCKDRKTRYSSKEALNDRFLSMCKHQGTQNLMTILPKLSGIDWDASYECNPYPLCYK